MKKLFVVPTDLHKWSVGKKGHVADPGQDSMLVPDKYHYWEFAGASWSIAEATKEIKNILFVRQIGFLADDTEVIDGFEFNDFHDSLTIRVAKESLGVLGWRWDGKWGSMSAHLLRVGNSFFPIPIYCGEVYFADADGRLLRAAVAAGLAIPTELVLNGKPRFEVRFLKNVVFSGKVLIAGATSYEYVDTGCSGGFSGSPWAKMRGSD